SINHAGELGQEVITGRINNTASVVVDQRGDHSAICCEGTDGGFFILAHEAAVACDIRTKDRHQLTFHVDSSPAELPLHCCYQCPQGSLNCFLFARTGTARDQLVEHLPHLMTG